MPGSPLAFVESMYDLEKHAADWLDGVARSARGAFGGRNLGAYALTYDASDVTDCRFSAIAFDGVRDRAVERLLREDFPRMWSSEPAVVEAVFRKVAHASSHDLPLAGGLAQANRMLAAHGVEEILGLNGVNPDGRGLHVGVLRPARAPADPDLLARLSSHLAASFRLRSRIARPGTGAKAEAVVSLTGRVEHAIGPAKLRAARNALAEAAKRIERLRGPAGRRDPERAVAQWRALVDAQWSLVDHFERDGKRFLVAQRNDPQVAPLAVLSGRESQVVALAAVGHSNKMIGYELGISVSTVGVLLTRASRKLGVRSRAALVAAYEEALGRGAGPGVRDR